MIEIVIGYLKEHYNQTDEELIILLAQGITDIRMTINVLQGTKISLPENKISLINDMADYLDGIVSKIMEDTGYDRF